MPIKLRKEQKSKTDTAGLPLKEYDKRSCLKQLTWKKASDQKHKLLLLGLLRACQSDFDAWRDADDAMTDTERQ